MYRYHRFHCVNCQAVRRFRKRVPDHRLHLRFTLLTLGLWSIGWLILTLRYLRRKWHCTFCYDRPRAVFESPPFASWPTPAPDDPRLIRPHGAEES